MRFLSAQEAREDDACRTGSFEPVVRAASIHGESLLSRSTARRSNADSKCVVTAEVSATWVDVFLSASPLSLAEQAAREDSWHCIIQSTTATRRGSRILKWGRGVNFCNNVIEPKPG